ncbi:MAG: PH domain-containing protein [Planctomycetales bacterium]|nr:PH domain-containing protein [Planctomycetales bacterium]
MGKQRDLPKPSNQDRQEIPDSNSSDQPVSFSEWEERAALSASQRSEFDFEQWRINNTLVFYRSPLDLLIEITVLILLVPLMVYLSVRYPSTVESFELFEIGDHPVSFALPLFALVPVTLLGYVVHKLYNRRYLIGPDHVRCVEGLLSLSKKDVRIDFEDLRGIEVDRSLIGRILNVGDVKIGSAMTAEVEVVFSGVFDPSKYRNMVDQKKRRFEEEFYKRLLGHDD